MKYKRLARSRRGLGKWHSLWLGEDHLLAVESTGYSEEYTRFYLKDIQAIITRRTAFGKVLNAILGIVVAISFGSACAGYNAGFTPESITAGIFGIIILPFLFWNLFRGPTCRCHVRVPLGIEELPALDRIKSVHRVLARLRPLIGQLQGEISRSEIAELTSAAKNATLVASPAALAAKPVPLAQHASAGTAATYRGGFHLAAFTLLIVDGAVSTLQIFHSPNFLSHISTGLTSIYLIVAIIALVKQTKHSLPSSAKWMIWGGIATVPAGLISGIVFAVYFQFENIQSGIRTKSHAFDLAAQAATHPVFALYLLVYALLEAGIGIAGLIVLGRGRGAVGGNRS
jgi:hypothetical protein